MYFPTRSASDAGVGAFQFALTSNPFTTLLLALLENEYHPFCRISETLGPYSHP